MSTNQWNDDRNNKKNNGSPKDLGEQIQDMVQSAVESLDFSGLGNEIRSAIEEAKPKMDEFKEKASRSRSAVSYRPERPKVKKPRELSAVLRKVPGRYSGPISFGIGMVGLFACLAFGLGLGVTILGGVYSTAIKLFLGLAGICGLGFLGLSVRGWLSYKRAARYLEYQKVWRDRPIVTIEKLKEETGYSEKQIKKDLRRIMEDKLLPVSYMDRQETCFILTREAWEQCQIAENARLEREKNEEQKRLEEEALAKASPQGKTILKMRKDAEGYKKELLHKKEMINGVLVKEKIDQLILMIDRIYECIEDHPEQYSQIYRLNDYYIPTILKLLTTYGEVENQPVQGDNIIKIKKEIEESLDMINKALQIMFDELFQDVAMDISADITVLETMLAREGLTEQGLKADEKSDIHFI